MLKEPNIPLIKTKGRTPSNLMISLGGSILLWAAWPMSPLTLLIFFAWIPVFWLEYNITSNRKFFGYLFLTLFIWNIATTYWIWNASPPGAAAAFIANSLFMCLPWFCFRLTKKTLGPTIGYISFLVYWIGFEFFHALDWGLSWTWLSLGNVFATNTEWIQWYEYTGVTGGSLWILVVNLLLFLHLKTNFTREGKKTYKYLIYAIPVLITPIIISKLIPRTTNVPASNNVVVVQPNIDPYEKISSVSFSSQLEQLIRLSRAQVDENTTLVLWPETAIFMDNGVEEGTMKENVLLKPLWEFLQQHPNIDLFTGVESYRSYENKKTSTARAIGSTGYYFDAFNGSVLLDHTGELAVYHKSMLVPGVETLPWFLKFIDSWFSKFGGTTAGYARQKERTVLNSNNGFRIAPSICYESVYGDFMRKYLNNGANIICIITNDGWWRNTSGHKQHMHYARLRAIETRTWVARSANTGISCFVDPYGTVINPQPYNKAASIKTYPGLSTRKTFFVQYGDVIGRSMLLISLALLLWVLTVRIIRKIIIAGKKPKTSSHA